MADGFTLDIDADLADQIEARAKAAGVTREALVRHVLEESLFRYENYSWIGDDPRTAVADYDPEAATTPWEEVEARLRAKRDGLLRKTA